jgi:tetrahydromethanopterin S-methyltransferase subunit E
MWFTPKSGLELFFGFCVGYIVVEVYLSLWGVMIVGSIVVVGEGYVGFIVVIIVPLGLRSQKLDPFAHFAYSTLDS